MTSKIRIAKSTEPITPITPEKDNKLYAISHRICL